MYECCSVLVKDFFMWRKPSGSEFWYYTSFIHFSFGRVLVFLHFNWLHYVVWIIAFCIEYWGRIVVCDSFKVFILFDYKNTFRFFLPPLSANIKVSQWLGRWFPQAPLRISLSYFITLTSYIIMSTDSCIILSLYFMLFKIFLFTDLYLALNW